MGKFVCLVCRNYAFRGTLVEDIILHGIGSGADSRTPRELQNDFPSDKIYAPELPVHPKDAYNYICCMNNDFDVGAIFIKSDINLKEYVFAHWINRSSKIDRRETNLSLSFCFK